LWKKNYHSWKRSLLARQARKMPFDTGGSDEGSKHKQKESSEPANSHDDPEVSHEGPQPKKVKTGTASLSTVNKSQNMSKSITEACLIAAATIILFSTQLD
jgi:hypothetical protein